MTMPRPRAHWLPALVIAGALIAAAPVEVRAADVPDRHATPADPAPDPAHVLAAWAAAVERRDWRAVRALWGHGGADSGLGPRAFARRWGRLRHPRVTIAPGGEEGAAGSLYYTAMIVIRDGARRIAGPVTLRRVNAVDGASAAQRRWHFAAGGGPATP
ncbi:MAG: hypothetical protein KGL54_05770 [Sphingomonadales bacterium]|nr:hypothetical protein [Sphingomonadales bacterium]